jgi:hypothetical protein
VVRKPKMYLFISHLAGLLIHSNSARDGAVKIFVGSRDSALPIFRSVCYRTVELGGFTTVTDTFGTFELDRSIVRILQLIIH